MRIVLRRFRGGVGRPDGLWLTLLLFLVVLVPSACLLWFLNQAVRNERLAARQKLGEAYRAHLSLAVDKLNTYCRQAGAQLEAEAERLPAPTLFARQVKAGLADALICFDAAGKIVYPGAAPAPKPEAPEPSWEQAVGLETTEPAAAARAFGRLAKQATNTDLGARALQAQARCLVRAGEKEAGVGVLEGLLRQERYRRATDGQGRLLVPNAQLMALELLKDSAPDRAGAILEGLKARLLDYSDSALSAPQRRFLMHEVQRLFPATVFPTLAAEDLAARCLEAGPVRPAEAVVRATALPGMWQLGSSGGRVLALHSTEGLVARMQAGTALQILPADVSLALLPPGKEAERALAALPADPVLPGWRLALSLEDPRLFDAAAEERITAYFWIGGLVVATVAVLGALALRLLRRQIAVTRLRNDLVANVTHELKTPLASMRLLVETLLNSPTLEEQTAREYLELIAQENARLSRLIDNFLAFSRMERNKYALDFKAVPAAAIVEGAAAAVRERFRASGCRFEVQAREDLPAVVADADALVTALVNLLDNAYKYSGDEKQITLVAGAEDGSVVFKVKDNGIGLSPRETKRIFRRFYQVDQRMSRTGSGCGLGLSIVKFIVKAHRGTVGVESQPGRGSTFAISVPAAEPAKSSASPCGRQEAKP